MEQPAWLQAAWAELGVREGQGAADSPKVLAYYREAGQPAIKHDEVAWCAAFAGAMLARAGLTGTGSLMARSYLDWGSPLEQGVPGAIAVLTRGDDPNAGHVGFLVGEAAGQIYLLGGNQDDAVSVAAFDARRLIGYRWPAKTDASPAQAAGTSTQQQSGARDIYETALAHVLEMEGGFSDDPYDPGGPTNQGITLDVYASFKGVTVDAVSRARLVDELRRIPASTVNAIYAARYWRPARCPDMPDPVALFHFDAAVNHGVAGAARMLQQAAGADADGEIGAQTLRAILLISPAVLVSRYADIRRARYRALPHFWRFGRGWLKRVDATLERANALISTEATSDTRKGGSAMEQTDTDATTQGKWWAQSKTIWGTLITAAATVLPLIGPLIGIELPAEIIRQFGDQALSVVQAVAGVVGTLLTIYGRLNAALPLARRDMLVRL